MSSEPTRVYEKPDVRVEWRPELCVHCGICIQELPEVFNLDSRPWVDIEGATAERIVQQVERCPSGALSLGAATGGLERVY